MQDHTAIFRCQTLGVLGAREGNRVTTGCVAARAESAGIAGARWGNEAAQCRACGIGIPIFGCAIPITARSGSPTTADSWIDVPVIRSSGSVGLQRENNGGKNERQRKDLNPLKKATGWSEVCIHLLEMRF